MNKTYIKKLYLYLFWNKINSKSKLSKCMNELYYKKIVTSKNWYEAKKILSNYIKD